MSQEEPTPGDGLSAPAPIPDVPVMDLVSVSKTKSTPEGHAEVVAPMGSAGDAADQIMQGPKPVPLPPPPIIDNLKYYSKQHAKLFGRGKLDQHGRKFPIEAAVRKLKQRGRARFVLERTWYSPLVSSES